MTLGSLFDGIGGFPLAGALHGITPVWASEVDPAAVRVTQAHFTQMVHLGDITALDGAQLPPVDIISGGSPCQDLSQAGRREGLAGERSGLFFEMVRVIREMREATDGAFPRYLVWENVAGALTSNKGADFETVITAFADLAGIRIECPRPAKWAGAGAFLADGFHLSWRVLDAKYFGTPQSRRRVYLVTDFGPQRGRLAPVDSYPASVFWDCEPYNPEGDQDPSWDDGEIEGAERPDTEPEFLGDNVPWRLIDRAVTYGDVPPVSIHVSERTNFYMGEEARPFTSTKAYYQAAYRLDRIGALTACDYKDPPVVITRWPDGWSYARRLSPRECLRLQGYPASWCQVEHPPLSSSDIYRLAGNSVALPCAEYIMRGIADEHRITGKHDRHG